MKKNWWKYLGALLVLYSVVMGLSVPLGPGILNVGPSELKQGQANTIEITGYRTHFRDEQGSLKVWIQHGKEKICANKIIVNNNENIAVIFEVPPLSTQNLTLVVNNNRDGNAVLEQAFWFNADEKHDRVTAFQRCETPVKNVDAADFSYPFLKILFQTIRNLFFHVPMWFSMIALLVGGMVYSIRYLKNGRRNDDIAASQITFTAMVMGTLGILTGMLWANFTWGQPWPDDPKLNSVARGVLVYLAYFILRGAIDDEEKRARISAVANVFFFPIFIVLIFVLPRLTPASLHPGNGGNPGFSSYDLDSTMRTVFYPAVLGWILVAYWIATLKIRVKKLEVSEDE